MTFATTTTTSKRQRPVLLLLLCVLLLCDTTPAWSFDPDTTAATLAFLNLFQEAMPKLQDLWKGTDFCGWSGVTCTDDGVSIFFDKDDVVGTLPSAPTNALLSAVESITFTNCPNLHGTLPSDWATLAALKTIRLAGTNVEGMIPSTWGNLNLNELNMSHCRLCGPLTKMTSPTLRTFSIDGNFLAGSLAATVQVPKSLMNVNLKGNKFCGCMSTFTPAIPANILADVFDADTYAKLTDAKCATANVCAPGANDKTCVNVLPPTTTSTTTTAAPSSSAAESSSSSGTATPSPTPTPQPPMNGDSLLFLQQFSNRYLPLRAMWVGSKYCTWPHITCNENSGAVTVDLSNMGLDGILPGMDIGTDGAQVLVEAIIMSSNAKVAGNLPDSWKRIPSLARIVLDNTAVTGGIPASWNDLTNLEEFSASNAYLCGAMPAWTQQNLTTFDISGNKMGGTLSPSFGSMSSLTTVHIQGNNFCGCVPKSWETNDVLSAVKADLPKRLTSQQCGVMNRCTANSNRCAFKSGASGPVGTALLASVATAAAMLLWVS